MIIGNKLMDEFSARVKVRPRLRTNFDLRNSEDYNSQRMLNVLELGTLMNIPDTNKPICVLRGSIMEMFYDVNGNVIESHILCAGSDCPTMVVSAGVWHELERLESGSILLTVKDGKFEPLKKEDKLRI